MKKLKGFNKSSYTEIPSDFSMDFGKKDISVMYWKDSKGNITTCNTENYNKNKNYEPPKWLSLDVGEYFIVNKDGKITKGN